MKVQLTALFLSLFIIGCGVVDDESNTVEQPLRKNSVATVTAEWTACGVVEITSSKDISNVVFSCEGSETKIDNLSGKTYTLSQDCDVDSVWVKSGNNKSGDGPGYGERFDRPTDTDVICGVCYHPSENGCFECEVDSDCLGGLVCENNECAATTFTVGDRFFVDLNGNGKQDIDDPGYANQTVNLWQDTDLDGLPDVLLDSRTTDANGNYLFANLNPDAIYVLEYVKSGGVFTLRNRGNREDLDSDVNANGLTGPINGRLIPLVDWVDAGVIL